MDNKEINIEVFGRVQGVRFRSNLKKIADSLGINGYVRNRENGEVIIVAQAQEKVLREFLSKIEKSPGFSRIEEMNWKWQRKIVDYKIFTISKKGNFFQDQFKSLKNLGRSILGKDLEKMPEHVVIIPDGNRRWAKEKGLEESYGHVKSAAYENLISLVEESMNLGIKYASFWAFSTDNWKRNDKEKRILFDLLENFVDKIEDYLKKNEIRFRHIGRKDRLPDDLIDALKKLEEDTKNFNKFNLQLLLDYGGRDEIVRAVNQLLKEGKNSISEETFSEYLDTGSLPDPDFIIRTSGEKRTSGLLPWQGGYAEWYFSEVYFPDFDVKEFRKAISEFSRRQRRFGGN